MNSAGWVPAAGLFALVALGVAAPTGWAARSAGAGEAPIIVGPPPEAPHIAAGAGSPRDVAVDACLQQNGSAPARVVEAVGDGMGDWLVWIRDRDGMLWSCNADAQGLVYTHVAVAGDLLEGSGSEFLQPRPAVVGAAEATDEAWARDLCAAVAALTQDVTVVATVPDGLGDYLVWLRMADDRLWMCNATAEAKLFVFEPVGFPIERDDELLTAEGPAI